MVLIVPETSAKMIRQGYFVPKSPNCSMNIIHLGPPKCIKTGRIGDKIGVAKGTANNKLTSLHRSDSKKVMLLCPLLSFSENRKCP